MTNINNYGMNIDPREQAISDAWRQFIANGGEGSAANYQMLAQKYDETAALKNNGSADGSTQDTPLADLFAAQQKAKMEQMKAQGLNPDGSPIAPQFQSLLDASGNLADKYKLNLKQDTQALDQFSQTALRGAGVDSPWAKLQLEQQGINQLNSADNAAAGSANSMLQAASRLAQTGGVSGGARERLARQGAQAGFIGRQGVERQGMLDRLNIKSQDEAQRMTQLGQLQGLNNTQADINSKVDQYNIGNNLKEVDSKRLFDSNQYNERMRAWAAGKSADAQRSAAGGGGKK